MENGDYIATHSLKDKLVFVAMALASGAMLYLFWGHAEYWFIAVLCGVMCCFSLFWAYVFFVSSVQFSSERIHVKVPPFVDYSKSYAEIKTMKTQRGNLRVGFAGGKSLSLPSGLGDPKKIESILASKTDVIPAASILGR